MSGVDAWRDKLTAFTKEASELLGDSEEAVVSRTFNVHKTLEKVSKLTFDQSESFKQSVRCVESRLYRSAFVMAWTANADILLDIGVAKISEIKNQYPKWGYTDKTSLSEQHGDYAIIEAFKKCSFISKSDMKSLHGQLHRRNECAHASKFFPTANQALGYIDETIASAEKLIELL